MKQFEETHTVTLQGKEKCGRKRITSQEMMLDRRSKIDLEKSSDDVVKDFCYGGVKISSRIVYK